MALSAVTTLYRCGECRDVHTDEDDARECCMPEIIEVYQCPKCQVMHDEHDQAAKCCGAGELARCPCCARDYGPRQIGYHAVQIAGHCQTCSPLFSVDHQMAIEEAHHEITGDGASLLRGEA